MRWAFCAATHLHWLGPVSFLNNKAQFAGVGFGKKAHVSTSQTSFFSAADCCIKRPDRRSGPNLPMDED